MVVVGRNAQIGDGCVLQPGAQVCADTVLVRAA
jgi:UDP-3-O-[3-hydroxymyristoyl] glucosamine N-acyltransferase